MRVGLIAVLHLFLLGVANAAAPEISLTARINGTSKFTATVSTTGDSTGCVYDLFSSFSRSRLVSDPANGFRLLSLIGSASAREQARSIGAVKGRAGKLSLHLRARATCGAEQSLSSIVKVKATTSQGQSSLSKNNFLKRVRTRFINATMGFEEAFPSLEFDRPIDLQNPGDGTGRVFVAEQDGKIFVLSSTASDATKSLFLDLTDKTNASGERGLLGLAFHPQYESNGFFYVNYTKTSDGSTVIARYEVSDGDANVADANSELILLNIEQPFANHNGGALAFGPDDCLYIALGDGGSANDPQGNGQDRTTLLGKILRINVDATSGDLNYSIPNDNPFVGNSSSFREEIFAYGLRNPWRITFDSENGDLWAADVGQNEIEEVDIIQSGGNYGWNTMEGRKCFNANSCDKTDLILPVTQYTHAIGESITGGYVYRGSDAPNLRGFYIYADFITGVVFAYLKGDSVNDFAQISQGSNISSFGVDEDNELYLLSYGDGKILRVVQE